MKYCNKSVLKAYTSGVISSGDDLDDYNVSGAYTCDTTAIAQSLSNTPHTSSNFKLFVIRNRTNPDTPEEGSTKFNGYQIIIASAGLIYVRYRNGDTGYTVWRKMAREVDIINSYSMQSNGYIKFGPLLGGLILQWGSSNTSNYTESNGVYSKTIDFNLALTTYPFVVLPMVLQQSEYATNHTAYQITFKSYTQFAIRTSYPVATRWFCIGV